MTDAPTGPQEGVAQALTDLTDQTTQLVRQEIDTAKQEVLDKLKGLAPAAGLLGISALTGGFALAAFYRFAIRAVDRVSPGHAGTVVAPAIFGTLSVITGVRGLAKLNAQAAPVPAETIRATEAGLRHATNSNAAP